MDTIFRTLSDKELKDTTGGYFVFPEKRPIPTPPKQLLGALAWMYTGPGDSIHP